MRVSSVDIYRRTVDSLMMQQSTISALQLKISAGKKIINSSDDPIGATQASNLRYEISKFSQFIKNADAAKNTLEYEDSILDSVVNIYQRIRELAINAGNASLGRDDREAVATEMEERLLELQDLANARDANGDYLFSGYKSKIQTVIKAADGQYVFQGDEGSRNVALSNTTSLTILDSGKGVFFNIPTDTVIGTATLGVATLTNTPTGLVNAGTLTPLASTDLRINDVLIPSSELDGISTTDAASSAIAIARAINSKIADHGVHAIVNPNSVDLGVYTAAPLVGSQFSINGVAILDNLGTENSLLSAINLLASQTGVIATQPGGAGTDFILTAQDGRNIQLQTGGGATASFANFNLTGAALDEVARSTVTLRSHDAFNIQGAFPSHAGFTAGTYSQTTNAGSGLITKPAIINNIIDLNETYSIIFNNPPNTFSIVADSDPATPLDDFNNVTYVPGQNIDFLGIRVAMSGTPSAGDVFGIEVEAKPTQDVFTTINTLITSIRNFGYEPIRYSYEIGQALNNISYAESRLIETRAEVGVRINIADSQKDFNDKLNV
ncbi:MAG TPA: flagellar hook-associated protein FlgL, partial [Candidatus Berkiella sp.]|nr:flagellar hook-associated protein FlgL [Candidatus Berkiella sp.]